jgi:predicted amino acid racemase
MFLDVLKRRNPAFLEAVLQLHEEKRLEANTYVLDLQTVRENTAVIKQKADQHGLQVYAMTKQVGYNPVLQRIVADAGIPSFVAVDWMAARKMHMQGFKLGHVGHLVQAPKGAVLDLVKMRPEVFTVFSVQKARELNEAAQKNGFKQNVLLRVYGENPVFYPGHEGGFFAGPALIEGAKEIAAMSHLEIAGVTSFPCMLFDKEAQDVRPTVNFETAVKAAELLQKELNIKVKQINTPGTNSSDAFEMMAGLGSTHVEPGHGLTGTTPLATVRDTAEKPAVLYLSEISHLYNGRGHVFGGGLYVDPVRGPYPLRAFVGKEMTERNAELIPAGGIDYYGYIDGRVQEGEPVIFGFRPQVFFTRGQVAAVDGIREGNPKVIGYYDSQGNAIVKGF